MKNRKKFLSAIVVPIVLTGVFGVQTFASEVPKTTKTEVEVGIQTQPRVMIQKEKTVTKWYPSHTDVPTAIGYSEFGDHGNWWEGTLYLDKIVVNGTGCTATFSGTLFSQT
ncbi:MAG: hypothetical protein ACRDDX_01335 [Cellulosilyticaceae bacterium]